MVAQTWICSEHAYVNYEPAKTCTENAQEPKKDPWRLHPKTGGSPDDTTLRISRRLQKRTHFHQDATCPVLAGAVVPDPPEGFERRILDQRRRSRGQEPLAELGILRELRLIGTAHDIEHHLGPVAAWTLARFQEPGFPGRSPTPVGIGSQLLRRGRRFGRAYGGAIIRVERFLRLKIMLDGRPGLAVERDRRRVEMRQEAELGPVAVEIENAAIVLGGSSAGGVPLRSPARIRIQISAITTPGIVLLSRRIR
jgi:hypothetical protein